MKKLIFAGLAALVILGGGALPGEAWGRHGFHRGHVFVGPVFVRPWGGWWGPPVWVDPYPAYVYRRPVIVEPAPAPVYVEPPQGVWYFCDDPQGYYPYVSQCPGGWREVTPQVPAQ